MPSDGVRSSRSRLTRRGRLVVTLAVVGTAALGGVAAAGWLTDRLAPPRCEFWVEEARATLTPEQAANAATISMVSLERGMPPRAATIALATAIQESKLRNLTYGDADSLGLFQQRPSQGWGSPEEVRDPVYASHAFYNGLEQVPGWETGVVTEVAQAVQRSAFPDAYADHEGEGRVLASVLTGHSPASLGCRLGPVESGGGSTAAVLEKAQRQFGAQGEQDADGRVVLAAGSVPTAWAVASWAVAHAEAEGITAVTVSGRRWERSGDPLEWVAAEHDGTAVVIEVG